MIIKRYFDDFVSKHWNLDFDSKVIKFDLDNFDKFDFNIVITIYIYDCNIVITKSFLTSILR